MKIVFICSTNASVVKKALSTSFLNAYSIEFVSDRECGAITFAKENNYSYTVLASNTGSDFSQKLAKKYNNNLSQKQNKNDIVHYSLIIDVLTTQ